MHPIRDDNPSEDNKSVRRPFSRQKDGFMSTYLAPIRGYSIKVRRRLAGWFCFPVHYGLECRFTQKDAFRTLEQNLRSKWDETYSRSANLNRFHIFDQ